MTTIITDIDAFVAAQNKNRGGALAGGGVLPLDYDALTGSVPPGGNAVTGISGIVQNGFPGTAIPAITLPSGANGNVLILDGADSTTPSTSGPDNYSLSVDTSGNVTVTDNNTGFAQSVTGVNYILFNGAATTSNGAYQSLYIIETGNAAVIASMYNAALGRVPDLPGLEYYADQLGTTAVPDLHTAAVYFENSPEFKTLYPALQTTPDNGGPNDQAFITELYAGILHRTPTASDMSFYVNYMQGTLSGETGPGNRADLLIYFANSPENQQDIAASSGGWLINPANGAFNQGGFNGQTVLAQEIASGTINAAAFSSIANSASVYDATGSTGSVGVEVIGAQFKLNGQQVNGGAASIGSSVPGITIDLSPTINIAAVGGQGDIVNGASSGGSIITVGEGAYGPATNNVITANLSGSHNIIEIGQWVNTGVTSAAIINGWNSTDIVSFSGNDRNTNPPTVTIVTGTSTNPASSAGVVPFNEVAVNLGTLADTSAAGIVAAANAVYKVGQFSVPAYEQAFFYAQDSLGDTFVYHWHVISGATTVTAAGIDGALELVGIPANSLTSANFH